MRTVFLGHNFTNGNDYRHGIAHRVCDYGLCGMDAGIKILLFHEELQLGLCLMMDYDLYYDMQLL